MLIHFGSGASVDDGAVFDPTVPRPNPIFRSRARFRDDLDVPVMVVNSETETLAYAGARQPDSDRFRFWEVAGAAHVSAQQYAVRSRVAERDGIVEGARPGPASHVSYVPAAGAALVHLQHWMTGGPPPPAQKPIEVSGDPAGVGRDAHGNAIGGVWMPGVEVPTARESGIGPVEGLVTLYGDHATYVARLAEAAAAAVAAGVLRPSDADRLVAAASAADGF